MDTGIRLNEMATAAVRIETREKGASKLLLLPPTLCVFRLLRVE